MRHSNVPFEEYEMEYISHSARSDGVVPLQDHESVH